MTDKKTVDSGTNKVEEATAKVAPRRTVDVDGRHYGPGQEVTLSLAEIKALQAKGFLLEEKPTKEADGVSIEQDAEGAGIRSPE